MRKRAGQWSAALHKGPSLRAELTDRGQTHHAGGAVQARAVKQLCIHIRYTFPQLFHTSGAWPYQCVKVSRAREWRNLVLRLLSASFLLPTKGTPKSHYRAATLAYKSDPWQKPRPICSPLFFGLGPTPGFLLCLIIADSAIWITLSTRRPSRLE